MEKVVLREKFAKFAEHWSPRVVGELNGQHVKLVKFRGEFLIVPRGVEHRPVADDEVQVMLFEPASTLNTGDVVEARSVREPGRV